MKKLQFAATLILSSFFLISTCFAQAPSGFTYQSVLRDANNDLIINTAVGTQISILQTTSMGTAVYVETHTASTNANGLLTLEVGSGSVVSGTFGSIDWSAGPYFIKAETDPAGGTSYTITGTQQMMSVPYALYAATSGSGSGDSDWTISGNDQYSAVSGSVGIGISSPLAKLHVNGTTNDETGGIKLTQGSSNSLIYHNTGNDLVIRKAAQTDQLVLDNGGSIGIGTATPGNKLHVEGAIRMVDGNQQAGYIPISDANGKMTWTAPSALAGVSALNDADNDTKIQVEESADEDVIRFDLGGTELFVMDTNGRLQFKNSGINVSIGDAAGFSGTNNTLIGGGAGLPITTGVNNTAIGRSSMRFVETGSRNVASGAYSLYSNVSGMENTAIGYKAGYSSTGQGNVFLGGRAGYSETGNNKLYIENSSSVTPLIYGEFDNDIVGINGNLGIGTQAPQDELHVEGSIRMVDGNQQAGFIPVSDSNGKMTWTDPSTIVTAADGDGSAINELQTLSQTGTSVTLSNGGGTISVADNDNSSTNELQTLSISGNDVSLSNTGGTIAIPIQTTIADADNDTKIQVEESADEDVIRFDLGGTEYFRMQPGKLEVLGNSNNMSFGNTSLTALSTGVENIAIGAGTLRDVSTGSRNVAIGTEAGLFNQTGGSNVFIGRSAGRQNESGSGNVFIGSNSGRAEMSSNKLYIENTSSNAPLIYGEFDNDIVGINGKLGIGTQAPQDELHVEGSIRMVDGNQQAGYVPVSDANGKMTWTDPTTITTASDADGDATNEIQTLSVSGADVTLSNGGGTVTVDDADWTVNGNNMYNANSGNVGFGTTAPTTLIGLGGDANRTIAMERTTASDGFHLTLQAGGAKAGTTDSDGGNLILSGGIATGNGSVVPKSNIIFKTATQLGTSSSASQIPSEKMRVTANGKLGLGTTNPEALFHISSTSTGESTGIKLTQGSANSLVYHNAGNDLVFRKQNQPDQLVLDTDGNVGIGTSAPTSKLYVQDNFASSGQYVATFQNTGNSGYSNGIAVIAGQNAQSVNNRFIAFVKPNGSEIGAIRQITSSSVDYNTTSDERLKTNINPTTKGLNDLMQIEVKDYVYKEDLDKPQTGFIAQQVFEHYPNAVSVGGDDVKTDPWMMDYGKMTPLLVKAVQDLTKLVEKQQKRIEQLEKNQR